MLPEPSHLEHARRARAYSDLADDAIKRGDWTNAVFYTRRAQQCASEALAAKGAAISERSSQHRPA